MKEFWNQRYSELGYAYGTEPNEFFKEALLRYKEELLPEHPRLLMPAEGEGRSEIKRRALSCGHSQGDSTSRAEIGLASARKNHALL